MLHLLGNEVHIAAIRGDISALSCLSRTESFELPGRSFRSALHAAAEWGCEKTVTWLLQQGAKINRSHGSPLQAAVERGHDNVVSLLLENGANATLPISEYGGVLVTAVFLERLSIVDLLTKKAPSLLYQSSAFGCPLALQRAAKTEIRRCCSLLSVLGPASFRITLGAYLRSLALSFAGTKKMSAYFSDSVLPASRL